VSTVTYIHLWSAFLYKPEADMIVVRYRWSGASRQAVVKDPVTCAYASIDSGVLSNSNLSFKLDLCNRVVLLINRSSPKVTTGNPPNAALCSPQPERGDRTQ